MESKMESEQGAGFVSGLMETTTTVTVSSLKPQ